MAKKPSYLDYLKQDFNELVDSTSLSELQKRFMKARWLDQLLWLEKRAKQTQNNYYRLRVLTIVGGVFIPALASLSLGVNGQSYVGWATFVLSQIVAISASIEEFFGYGDRYRRYRRSAEQMKHEGWSFLQLSGRYREVADYEEAYPIFASRVESIIKQDVEDYLAQMLQQEEKAQQQQKQLQNPTRERGVVVSSRAPQPQSETATLGLAKTPSGESDAVPESPAGDRASLEGTVTPAEPENAEVIAALGAGIRENDDSSAHQETPKAQ